MKASTNRWFGFMLVLALLSITHFARADAVSSAAPGSVEARIENLQRDRKYDAALPLAEKLLAEKRTKYGSRHRELGAALVTVGTLYHRLGDYGRAVEHLESGRRMIEVFSPKDGIGPVPALLELGHLEFERGEYTRAQELFNEASRRAPGKETQIAEALIGLGNVKMATGAYSVATACYDHAVELLMRAVGPNEPSVAAAQVLHARAHLRAQDPARAETIAQRALGAIERGKHLGDPVHAEVLCIFGEVFLVRGEPAQAVAVYGRAAEILEKSLGRYAPSLGRVLSNLALLYEATGDSSHAVEMRARAEDIAEHHARMVFASGSETEKQAYLASLTQRTYATLSLQTIHAHDSPVAARLALETVLRRKGRVFDAMSKSTATMHRRLSPEDRALGEQLRAARSALARVSIEGPGDSYSAYHDTVKRLESEISTLEAKISTRTADLGTQEPATTVEAVQARIPEGSALVEIVAFTPRSAADDREATEGPPRYVAYVLHGSGPVRWVDLGEAKRIELTASAFRQALGSPKARDVEGLARGLDELVMRPLRPLLDGAKNILISPDGLLNLVPFAALVDETGAYLVSRYTFVYLTSGRDLLRIGHNDGAATNRSDSEISPLIYANPDFGEAVRDGRPSFGPLPGTLAEADDIARMFPRATKLTGREATKDSLLAVHAPRILHVATHGFFLSNKAQGGRQARGLTLDAGRAHVSDNPLVRSGIALARANDNFATGVLTALEATGTDLVGTQLVVLSACESAVGDVSAGEGVYGLRRALGIAGAESQVMSLWKVDDMATRMLMVNFYDKLRHGRGRGEALREAQIELAASPSYGHPYFWAAFIPSGDWRPLIGTASRETPVAPVCPGPRGCSCRQGSTAGQWRAPLLFAGIALISVLRRARCQKQLSLPVRGRLLALAASVLALGCGGPTTARTTALSKSGKAPAPIIIEPDRPPPAPPPVVRVPVLTRIGEFPPFQLRTGPPRLTALGRGGGGFASADGSVMVLESSNFRFVWTQRAGGGSFPRVDPNRKYRHAVSPDGQRVAQLDEKFDLAVYSTADQAPDKMRIRCPDCDAHASRKSYLLQFTSPTTLVLSTRCALVEVDLSSHQQELLPVTCDTDKIPLTEAGKTWLMATPDENQNAVNWRSYERFEIWDRATQTDRELLPASNTYLVLMGKLSPRGDRLCYLRWADGCNPPLGDWRTCTFDHMLFCSLLPSVKEELIVRGHIERDFAYDPSGRFFVYATREEDEVRIELADFEKRTVRRVIRVPLAQAHHWRFLGAGHRLVVFGTEGAVVYDLDAGWARRVARVTEQIGSIAPIPGNPKRFLMGREVRGSRELLWVDLPE